MIFLNPLSIYNKKALLKEDGSLDVERINKLPIDEYMKEIEGLTREQRKEYYSKEPNNENHEKTKIIEFDCSMEEEIKKYGSVSAEDIIKQLREFCKKH